MEKLQFSTEITASAQRVWNVLWQDETFRQWADIIDPGTYMKGDLKEGGEVQFISAENGYGVTSLVEKYVPNEFLLLKHHADTQNGGKEERTQEWTGGEELYTLADANGGTTLTVVFDVPAEMTEYFTVHYPEALAKVKQLAEKGNDKD